MSWSLTGFTDEAGDKIDQQIATAQQAGLRRIDLRSVEGHNISVLPHDVANHVAQKLAAAKIEVCMFGSPLGKIDIAQDFEIDLAKMRHLASLKPIFGCAWVRVFSYYNRGGAPKQQWRDESLRRLAALKDLAQRHGMVLFHENEHGIFGQNLAENLELIHALRDADGRGAFRAIFDFDNYNNAGDDVWENWLKLRDLTDAFHLKDSDKEKRHVPVGQGNGQVRRILADALARKWVGPLSLEPHLTYSAAVLATGPSGSAHQALKDMSPAVVWQIAATAAKDLFRDLGVAYD